MWLETVWADGAMVAPRVDEMNGVDEADDARRGLWWRNLMAVERQSRGPVG